MTPGTALRKRALDLSIVVLTSPLTLPLMGIIALLVRCQLGRPVLFAQQRPGRHGRLFTMYKFRSMLDAHDATGRPLPDKDRLTSFGRLLRGSSLDELPELFNVARGEMSLVGPRPLLVQYLVRYTPEQARRHEVPPGITGWAQVNGRNTVPWDERFKMDVWYVNHCGLLLDLRILLLTMKNVLLRKGINAPGAATMHEFNPAVAESHPPDS